MAKTAAHYVTLSVSTDCNCRTLRLGTTPVNSNNTTQFPPRNSKKLKKKLDQNKQNSQQPIKLRHCWQSTTEHKVNRIITKKPETSSLNLNNCCLCQQMSEWEENIKSIISHLNHIEHVNIITSKLEPPPITNKQKIVLTESSTGHGKIVGKMKPKIAKKLETNKRNSLLKFNQMFTTQTTKPGQLSKI